ncbi:uncharacterized protein [Littorina saxatilis]|uniref:uncharacterized protein n=1 Tax=Littorina saxatilis TaxID=31220 RepID=UPI0038B4F687
MSSALTALCMLALALTARLEVFLLTAVVAGFQRACNFSVCYAVMNDVMQSMAAQSADGKSKTGLAMSLVSACTPLAYCTLYTLVGPLEDLTGMVSVPLWIGTACCCLSSAAILFLGKI